MKKHSYGLARSLTSITGVIFISQGVLDLVGIVDRKPGFELLVPVCGAAFAGAVIYSLVLLALNTNARRKEEG
jgi:hypothetical protein